MPCLGEQPPAGEGGGRSLRPGGEATSVTSACRNPMPAAGPFTAATIGFGISSGNVCGRRGRVDSGVPAATPASASASRPAQKPRPEPVTTIARTDGSKAASARRSK